MTQEVMEPKIWENFPEDLFKDVLARLPIATIIDLRTVCRQWNNLITSQSFSQHCVQVSKANPWFYIVFGDDKVMYEPFAKRWYHPNTFEILASPVSSAGGLVCFIEHFYQNLYVCNPLNKSFKKLRAGSIKNWGCSGITMNGIGGYKVLRLSRDNREYEIYDSVTENWSHQEKIPECIKMQPDYIILNPVSINNTLYFKHISPEAIVSYNTSTGVWTQHLIQAPLHSSSLVIAESDGRIMLVGMLTENNAKSVCIWEVQKVTFLLMEVDRWSCSEFNGRVVHLTCWGNKGLLLCYMESHSMHCMFTYNIATRKWIKVHVPYGIKPRAPINVRGIAFQPCLTAMP